MRRPLVKKFRRVLVCLALAALAVFSAACSGSGSPASSPEAAPIPAGATPLSDTSPSEGETAVPFPTELRPAATVQTAAQESPAPGGAGQTSSTSPAPTVAATAASTPPTEGGTPESTLAPTLEITADLLVAAFEEVLNRIYEGALPSVVYIRVPNPVSESLFGVPSVPDSILFGAGSGFVWDNEGHIVTNHHVIEPVIEPVIGSSGEVSITFADSTQAMATVVGSDPHSDLAVLKIVDGDSNFQPASLGDSDNVRVGQLAVALGAPFGQEFTMTSGIVSAVGRDIRGEAQFTIPEVIQTDSAINPGNSGGPLLDSQGRVIGINTQIISRSGSFSGVGMAVPVNIARRVVPSLIEDGQFDYPWLGVNILAVSPAYAAEAGLPEGTRGAIVVAVLDGSPADLGGLRGAESSISILGVDYPAGGDIILAIGPHIVDDSSDLIAHLTYQNRPGDTVAFTVLRDDEEVEVDVTLGKRPELR